MDILYGQKRKQKMKDFQGFVSGWLVTGLWWYQGSNPNMQVSKDS